MIKYLITDPKYYTNDKKKFEEILINILDKQKVDIACFRDKESSNFEELAKVFIEICKKKNVKNILINGNFLLAKKLHATGVHLTSLQFDKIQTVKELGLYVIISCHTFEDIGKALENKANVVTFSPIFHSPNKGEPKGIAILKEAVNTFKNIDIIALGGIINENQINQISETKAYGFASIRYFV